MKRAAYNLVKASLDYYVASGNVRGEHQCRDIIARYEGFHHPEALSVSPWRMDSGWEW